MTDLLEKAYKVGFRNFITKSIFKTNPVVHYTKEIPIGFDSHGELVTINFNQTNRILVLGASGSGKSFLVRGVMNRAYLAGLSPIIFDPAPEFYTSREPVQQQFRNKLLPIEYPRPFPVSLYYPFFLHKFVGLDLPKQQLFQMNIGSLNASDLFPLLDYDKLPLRSQLEVNDLVSELLNKKTRFKSLAQLQRYLMKKIKTRQTLSLLSKQVQNIRNLEVMGPRYPFPNFIEDIRNRKIIDINLYGWRQVDFKRFVSIYISVILRRLMNWQEQKIIKPLPHLLLIFDEAHELVPKKGNRQIQTAKTEIEKIAQMSRKYNTSAIFITQHPETISPIVIGQCNEIFINNTIDFSLVRDAIKNWTRQYYENPWELSNMVRDIYFDIPKYGWLLIKRGATNITIIKKTLAPLSKHRTEGI